jgi:two-component system, OmpR family, response regulator RegX3
VKVLVVEDDDDVADALGFALEQHGFAAMRVATGEAALTAAAEAEMVLLDLGLPDLDGYEVCRRLRGASDTAEVPIVAVTARSDEIDRVLLLKAGADDYIVKPYGVHELLARIEAVARRAARAVIGRGDLIKVGRLRVDLRARQVEVDGVPVGLTSKEFDLLAVLAADAGAVHTREAIVARVWDDNWFGSSRTLDVHMGALRAKLGDRRWVKTVRGVGFRLADPGDG